MATLTQIYTQRIINYLSQEGRRIVTTALNSKYPKNDSFNQADAFGYVVYYKGQAVRKGYATMTPKSKGVHRGWEREGIPNGTGRQWLDNFVNTYKEVPKDGFALLIVNAAFYSKIHEEKYKYQVISQVFSELGAVGKKFKVAKEIRKI